LRWKPGASFTSRAAAVNPEGADKLARGRQAEQNEGTNERTMVDWRGTRRMTLPWAAAIGLALLILFSAGEPGRVVKEDFSGKAPGKGWRVSSGAWKVEAGELHFS